MALRASIVIGARSRSFRLLVHLVERMPVLTLPAWRRFRTQPIDERDIIEMLAAAAGSAAAAGRSLDVGGPDVLSYGEMIARIAELMLVHRPSLGARRERDPARGAPGRRDRRRGSGAGAAADGGPAGRSAAGATTTPPSCSACELHSFDSAVEHALAEWEEFEPLAAR